MAVISRVPFDIWERIAEFLSDAVIATLAGLNRPFYDIAMRSRYEVITLTKFDGYTKWLCLNLADPKFQRNEAVKRVELTPWLVEPRTPGAYTSTSTRSSRLYKFLTLIDPELPIRELHDRTLKRVHKDTTLISTLLSSLPNATEYNLSWDPTCKHHPEFFRAFLKPVLTKMAPRLTVLELKVPTDALYALVPITLPSLQRLSLTLCTLDTPKTDLDVAFDALTVFTNNLFPTLLSLSIASVLPSRALDFTRLFRNLGTFPRLVSFGFSIPFDGAHIRSPSTLAAFLRKHAGTLWALQLTVTRCSAPDAPLPPSSKYWIPTILAALTPSNDGDATPGPNMQLHDLHIALRPLRADLTPILAFLRTHARTLRTLTLADRRLSFRDTKAVLRALASPFADRAVSPLVRLRIRIERLSPPFLGLLARGLPALGELGLEFPEVVASAGHLDAGGLLARSRSAELEAFVKEARAAKASYAHWDLGTLCIPPGMWFGPLTELFRGCLPGVRVKELGPAPALL